MLSGRRDIADGMIPQIAAGSAACIASGWEHRFADSRSGRADQYIERWCSRAIPRCRRSCSNWQTRVVAGNWDSTQDTAFAVMAIAMLSSPGTEARTVRKCETPAGQPGSCRSQGRSIAGVGCARDGFAASHTTGSFGLRRGAYGCAGRCRPSLLAPNWRADAAAGRRIARHPGSPEVSHC